MSIILPPTDYRLAENWLEVPHSIDHAVDTLYFYPTCYAPLDPQAPLVCSAADPDMRLYAKRCLAKTAGVFSPSSNIFAPFYRQCNAFAAGALPQREMLALYERYPVVDICAALDYYFQNFNGGRPFILAGHSQGSLMILYALSLYFPRHLDYYRRLVAAYAVGFGVFDDYLADNPHLRLAQGEDDLGVIVSFNTESPRNKGYKNIVLQPGSHSINPLNWRTDDTYAPLSLNKGSLYSNPDGSFSIGPALADAQLDLERGVVLCRSLPEPNPYLSCHIQAFGPASYHSHDYAFYYLNLRDNVSRRVGRYLSLEPHLEEPLSAKA